MPAKHYETYRGETYIVKGLDTGILVGIIGLVSISIQFFLTYFVFENAAGFLVALTLLAHPLVFGISAIILSKKESKVDTKALLLGIITTIVTSIFYFKFLLPKTGNPGVIYTIISLIGYVLVTIGIIIRFSNTSKYRILEILTIGVGTILFYIIYLGLWVDVFTNTLFGG